MDDQLISILFKIAESKDFTTIENFAQVHSIDLASVRNSRQVTLLHIAAGFRRVTLMQYLIAQGADIDAVDSKGQSALHNACCHGHFTTASKLIEAGATVDLLDNDGWSPLKIALARKYNAEQITPRFWKIVELLLASGANPYLKSKAGHNCFKIIQDKEDRRVIRLSHLLNKLKDCDRDDNQSEFTRINIVNSFLSVPDFFELVKIGDENLDTLKLLITPELIRSCLSDCNDITPLHRAAGYNHLEVARLFIAKGASVDTTDSLGRIPLHNAAQYGHVEMIELLVESRSDINRQDFIGYSPLHVAASNKTFIACLKLIQLGADKKSTCRMGKLPYDLAESGDVREVLKLESIVPSTSVQPIYMDIQPVQELLPEPVHYSSPLDDLMLNSDSDERLFRSSHTLKIEPLSQDDSRYQKVKKRMLETIMTHNSESGGRFSSYEILSIKLILNEKVWSKYRLACRKLEIEYGPGSKNEKLLFHGSNCIDGIQNFGFDERYANMNSMFGAGLYFAKHSSKSNQYTFGWDQGCQQHGDKSCYICERKMIYAQVALGRSLVGKEAMPCAHAPPGHSSVTGAPESTANLVYPEYVIYNGDQAYPLFVIKYKILPPATTSRYPIE